VTLFLDALNPPAPAQLVADLAAVGATACGYYVLRRTASGGELGIGTWSSAHVTALRQAGIGLLAIIVPGDNPLPSDPLVAMDIATALGAPAGAIAIDLENFSTPSAGWVSGAIDAFRAGGWKALRYGDVALLDQYPVGDGDWVSHGYIPVRDGDWSPIPALPNVPGLVGDQYCVNVTINHSSYDASVFDPSVFIADQEADMPFTQGFKVGMANVAIKAVYGRGPTPQELTDTANAINDDGSNYGDLVQGLYNNLGNADVARLQSSKLADEVDVLKAATPPTPSDTVPPHTHPVALTSGPAQP
jgi:hypothetical protein